MFNRKNSLMALFVALFSTAVSCKPAGSSSETKFYEDREHLPKEGSKCTVTSDRAELIYLDVDREVRFPVKVGDVLTVAKPEPVGTVNEYVAAFTKVELPESVRSSISTSPADKEKPTAWIRKELCKQP
jgi:hypothetical protein